MVHQLGLFLAIFSLGSLWAQDERFYREILREKMPSQTKIESSLGEAQFNIDGPIYAVDLNDDGVEETIQAQKRDGVDWIEIRGTGQRKLFESKLLAMGNKSVIYKIRLARISSHAKLLMIFLDEGMTQGKKIESSARIFLLTFENNDFSSFKLTVGPHFFHEKKAQREQYWSRDYSVELRDVNKDGVRDVVVTYNHIQRILLYKGRGEWERH